MDSRSSAGEESARLVGAELRGAEEEADLPRVIDNLRIVRVPLGPKGVHGPDAGLIFRVHMVEDARGPLRPVPPVPPRAATGARAFDKRPPPHVLAVVLHPSGVARAHTSHRVEGSIEVPRVEMDVRGCDISVSLPAAPREATGRPWGHTRGTGPPPIRGGLRLGPSRVTWPGKRESPIRPCPNRTDAEDLTVAAPLAGPMERVGQRPVPVTRRGRRSMSIPLRVHQRSGRIARGRRCVGEVPRAAATSADDIGGDEGNPRPAAANLISRRVGPLPSARDLV